MTTARLFAFEDNPELLSFRFNTDDFLMYPAIRLQILQNSFDHVYSLSKAHASAKDKNFLYYFRDLYYLFGQYFKKLPNQFDILFLERTFGWKKIKTATGYFNKTTDPLVLVADNKTLLIENPSRGNITFPRVINNYNYSNLFFYKTKIFSKVLLSPTAKDRKTVSDFIAFLRVSKVVGLDDNKCKYFEKQLLKLSLELRFYKKYYLNLFKKYKPKVVFIQDAADGTYCYLNKWANELGIITAEFQHGVITKGHFVYHYQSNILQNKEYKKYLPQYILTFGTYWNSWINCSLTYEVGNPAMQSINSFIKTKSGKKNILVISQGDNTKKYVDTTTFLAKTLPAEKYHIIHRLHPDEVTFTERYRSLQLMGNVQINSSGDIYQQLVNADFVVGGCSAALYEALKFNKTVYSYDDEYTNLFFDETVSLKFKTNAELKHLIDSGAVKTGINPEHYWNEHWQENYIRFLKEIVRIEI